MDETKTNIPVSEGTVTIAISEYRGLIERAAAAEGALAAAENESVSKGARLYDKGRIIDVQNKRIADLERSGKQMCDFLDSKPHLRAEFNLFLHERALDRKAADA